MNLNKVYGFYVDFKFKTFFIFNFQPDKKRLFMPQCTILCRSVCHIQIIYLHHFEQIFRACIVCKLSYCDLKIVMKGWHLFSEWILSLKRKVQFYRWNDRMTLCFQLYMVMSWWCKLQHPVDYVAFVEVAFSLVTCSFGLVKYIILLLRQHFVYFIE